jgi:hypothetical protein
MEKGISKPKLATILLIIALTASSLIMVEFASAQSIPKPSVPQFSIQVVDYSYDTPTTYYTDPYTGKQGKNLGYHVEEIRVEGEIKNQHFNSYSIPNPNTTSRYDTYLTIDFYYDIRYKGRFEAKWTSLYGGEDYPFLKQEYGNEFTNFTVNKYNTFLRFQDGDQIDFQVRAVIGYETWGFVSTWPYRILNGEGSGWSETLTVTISKNDSSNTYASTIDNTPYPTLTSPQPLPTPTPTASATPTQNPTVTPTEETKQPVTQSDVTLFLQNQTVITVAVSGILVAVLALALVFYRRRVNKKMPWEAAA